MPKSQSSKITDAIDALKKYSNLDHAEAVEVLSKTLPEVVAIEVEPLTSIPVVNNTIDSMWSFFAKSKTVVSRIASHVNNNIIHNEELSSDRLKLVLACVKELESESDEPAQMELLEQLVFDNMQLSLQHLGAEYTYSGNLHRSLCIALDLSNSDANRLCRNRDPELAESAVAVPTVL